MVIQLTRRGDDGTSALFSHLDQKPARLCAADRPAVHAVSLFRLFRPSRLLIDALEPYAFPAHSDTRTTAKNRTFHRKTHLRGSRESG
ncbi:hypothetical protein GCM10017557_31810 [Streptomyces aurantiacus]|uniref:Uncharacterized protein n=1 Tax=Streptomyces aurantiacus TaxID=47760 RepID=A0A7G1P034_9ACTN|nr:hypothetical protein GCM10017557_31810 [Streptomyces aurantiacus]